MKVKVSDAAMKQKEKGDYSNCKIFKNTDRESWQRLAVDFVQLVEVYPDKFLNAVEKTLQQSPCSYQSFFSQGGADNTGKKLLQALETLAWDEAYLSQVCSYLGQLASYDPIPIADNDLRSSLLDRPINSLRNIFCPWYVQTMTPFEKRKMVLKDLQKKYPELIWQLILRFLPSLTHNSNNVNETYKPKWCRDKAPPLENYSQQVQFYFDWAVEVASHDLKKLSVVTQYLYCCWPEALFLHKETVKTNASLLSNNLSQIDDVSNNAIPKTPLLQLSKYLKQVSSKDVLERPESERLNLCEYLEELIFIHKTYPYVKWNLGHDNIFQIEKASENLTPRNPLLRYRRLFSEDPLFLYHKLFFPQTDKQKEERENKLSTMRKKALKEIINYGGVDTVIKFAKRDIEDSREVGTYLAICNGSTKLDSILLPQILFSKDKDTVEHLNHFLSGYIEQRQKDQNSWVDQIDQSNWSEVQINQFSKVISDFKRSNRVSEGEAQLSEIENNIEALIQCSNPLLAFSDLHNIMCTDNIYKKQLSPNLIREVLRAVILSKDVYNYVDEVYSFLYQILKGDKQLQQSLNDFFTDDPELFCRVIELSLSYQHQPEFIKISQWLIHQWEPDKKLIHDKLTYWFEQIQEVYSKQEVFKNVLFYLGQIFSSFYSPFEDFSLSHQTLVKKLNSEEYFRKGFIRTLFMTIVAKRMQTSQNQNLSLFTLNLQQQSQMMEKKGYFELSRDLANLNKKFEESTKCIQKLAEYLSDEKSEKLMPIKEFCNVYEDIEKKIIDLAQDRKIIKLHLRENIKIKWYLEEVTPLYCFLKKSPDRFSRIELVMSNKRGEKTRSYDAVAYDSNESKVYLEITYPPYSYNPQKKDWIFFCAKHLQMFGMLSYNIDRDHLKKCIDHGICYCGVEYLEGNKIIDQCLNLFKIALEKKINKNYDPNTVLIICVTSGVYSILSDQSKWQSFTKSCQDIVNKIHKKTFKEIFVMSIDSISVMSVDYQKAQIKSL